MIIRRYVVNDMREAIIRAKYELGNDAIIISQKHIRPGKWYNLFRKRKLEVTVAIEEDVHEKAHAGREKASRTADVVSIKKRRKGCRINTRTPGSIAFLEGTTARL